MKTDNDVYDQLEEITIDKSLLPDPNIIPVKSVEGWIIVVRGVHEEAQEEDVRDAFENFGTVRNLHLNLDRRTGYVKGYALIEFGSQEQAIEAIKGMNGKELLGKNVEVGWVFVKA